MVFQKDNKWFFKKTIRHDMYMFVCARVCIIFSPVLRVDSGRSMIFFLVIVC